MIVLTHVENVSLQKLNEVKNEVEGVNPFAVIISQSEVMDSITAGLKPIPALRKKLDHHQTHWSSCSVDLPGLSSPESILEICNALPESIVRVKGCTRIGDDSEYTYFERCPDGQIFMRPYSGTPVTGAKLLTVGPGSHPELLQTAVSNLVHPETVVNQVPAI